MTETEQIEAAKNFSHEWRGRGKEEVDYQIFWITLLRDVFGVEKPEKLFAPQEHIKIGKTFGKIDLYMPKTKVLIEQKSFGIDLNKKYNHAQKLLTPFEQAKLYADNLPNSMRPRWIITCNFSEFQIYDMKTFDNPLIYFMIEKAKNPDFKVDFANFKNEPVVIKLADLPNEYKRLNFLIDPNDENIYPEIKISKSAANIVKKIRDDFEKNYHKENFKNYTDFINKICTRLVFCFYAGDANIFHDNQFFNYLESFADKDRNDALQKLFEILDTPIELRDKSISEQLKNFPYVNGGLFSEKILLPSAEKYLSPINSAILYNAGKNFSWQTINPTIFGAMFESILNPETQRKGGMHFTSVENIHKVIDPLFLDELHEEFKTLKHARRNKIERLKNFQDKLASLKFFDPACGSGNFLTETYISLRRLENKILKELNKNSALNLFGENSIKISINQFYGIEINDYAVAVAQVALWIAENQMLQETEKIIAKNLNPLPLKNYPNIVCANALQIDWSEVCPNPNFIIGNPPFVGRRYQTSAQKQEIAEFFSYKDVDYVACWFKKAAEFLYSKNSSENNYCIAKIQNEIISANQKFNNSNFCEPKIECAFVATNSITQGEQVAAIWENLGVEINFAYRTFQWQSESENMAHVHCVIISFANFARKQKIIFDGEEKIFAENINGYLQNAPNVYIKNRTKTLQKNIPPMFFGNMAADNKNFSLTEDEKNYFLEKYPESKKFIKNLIGGEEFLNGKKRFCFWFKDFSLEEIKKFPEIYRRVEKIREFRLNSTFKKIADRPHEFRDLKNPKKFLAVPQVSSENRKYIPIDFLDENFIPTTQLLIIPDANLFHFGILNSSVHMAWTKNFCGRLEMRLRYSATIIYNNFVWCEATAENVEKITATAEKILRVRKKYFGWTLAQLYNTKTMPEDLRLAHLENDSAVLSAYGFDKNFSEEEIVSALMILYKNLTEK